MIESLVKGKDVEKSDYPYIGAHKYSKCVVLFTKPDTGSCIGTCELFSAEGLGEHRTDWVENEFLFLDGTVTLSNKLKRY